MSFKKINFKSKRVIAAALCTVIAAGALTMVAVTDANKNEFDDMDIIQSTHDANANVQGVEKETTTEAQSETENTEAVEPTEDVAASTESSSMESGENNVPYKSFYQYPLTDVVNKAYSDGQLVFSQTMNDYRSHNGTDFDAKDGDKVKAINDGIVMSVTKDNMWGTCVEIDHGNKMVAKYCGIKETTLKKGDRIKIGENIGQIGFIPIEATDGTHLHLEIKIDGKLVDPIKAMNKNNKN